MQLLFGGLSSRSLHVITSDCGGEKAVFSKHISACYESWCTVGEVAGKAAGEGAGEAAERPSRVRTFGKEPRHSDATVVTLFLSPALDERLESKLLALKPGTRIVSHAYLMDDWPPDDRIITPDGMAYLWVVPAPVDGSWTFRSRAGRGRFTVTFIQNYQQLRGVGDNGSVLTDTRLSGTDVAFDFPDGIDLAHVTGQVDGAQIIAKVTRNGRTRDYVGTRS